ncbi:AraC family transcriptional regulator [Myceligenerans indicum]|uniref:AraC family transcriptional regulator n=1 Tax=Myceligenerans indicum TaxID=2593663 RepID=A0ABS1LQJ4_9MICO|nr:AraC family transcriptional regulator [Myceligenerans indicum]MBL0888048.1 AraC family transcriptional regulator [Myceligenerans indicum]
MDETTISDEDRIRDGFAGQRMVVVPRPVVRETLTQPVTSRLLVTDAGFFPHAARHGRSRPDGAHQHILMVCTDGSGWCRMPGGRHTVERGDAVLIPAGSAHEYAASASDPWTLWWMHVIGIDAAELVQTAHASAAGPVSHLRDPAPVASLISQTVDALDMGTAGGALRAAGAAWHALALVAANRRRVRGPEPSSVERAVEHLRATTPKRTSVEALAALVGLGVSQFSALFREHVGVPPLRYQSDLRMARARELLDTTDQPVAAIARSCGYDDALYFTRQFTRTHGLSPTAFRQRAH